MIFDEIDVQMLRENFDDETISKLDSINLQKIFAYLYENKIDYAKDLFINDFDLFLLPSDIFIKKFEKLRNKLGSDFVNKLGEDTSLIEIMYED